MANGGEQTEDTAEGLDLRPYLLRAAMERNGWSQAKLAKVAGTSQVTISRIVNGKGNVSDDLVARVLAVAEGQP
jgi:transcriptional regulator with XRE-family HTH domain